MRTTIYGEGSDNPEQSGVSNQTNLSVEAEALRRYPNLDLGKYEIKGNGMIVDYAPVKRDAFLAGHTHALQSSNLVELDEVVRLINEKVVYLKLSATNTTKSGKYACGVAIDQLTDLITQIKNLNKKA